MDTKKRDKQTNKKQAGPVLWPEKCIREDSPVACKVFMLLIFTLFKKNQKRNELYKEQIYQKQSMKIITSQCRK